MIVALLGVAAFGALIGTAVLGLVLTGPDVVQGELVRLIYIHPPIAWVTYVAVAVAALGSALWLWPRTRAARWDDLAASSAELGVVFCGLALVTGSIWGRPTWGVWWTWDARLTSTALLFSLLLGYLAIRRSTDDPDQRARRAAVTALVAAVDIPVVHFSVKWWRTLHQQPTVLRPDPQIHGAQAWTMLLGFVAMTLVFAWLLAHRMRVARLERAEEARTLDIAIAERRAEAVSP